MQKSKSRPRKFVWVTLGGGVILLSAMVAVLLMLDTDTQPTSVDSISSANTGTTDSLVIQSLNLQDDIQDIEWSPTRNEFAILINNRIWLGQLNDTTMIFEVKLWTQSRLDQFGDMQGLVFSADGAVIMTSAILDDGTLAILRWDTQTQEELTYWTITSLLQNARPPSTVISFTGNGEQGGLILTNLDADSRRWSRLFQFDLNTGEPIELASSDDPDLQGLDDPGDIAYGDDTFAVQVFGNPSMRWGNRSLQVYRDGDVVMSVVPDGQEGLRHMTLSHDGAFLAGTSYELHHPTDDSTNSHDNYLHVWLNNEQDHKLTIHYPIVDMIFTPDNEYLIFSQMVLNEQSIVDTASQQSATYHIDIKRLDLTTNVIETITRLPMEVLSDYRRGTYDTAQFYDRTMAISPDGQTLLHGINAILFRVSLES